MSCSQMSNLPAKCPIPGVIECLPMHLLPSVCCCIKPCAVCITCCVYCLWFNIHRRRKKNVLLRAKHVATWLQRAWPQHGCRHICAHTHWQKPVLLDWLNCSGDSSRVGQETARAQIGDDQLRWVWDPGQQHWGRVIAGEKEGKTWKKMVIKSYLLNIPNKHTPMRISFRSVND